MKTPKPPSESTNPTSAESNPSADIDEAAFQATAAIKPWGAIGGSILAFISGEILFFVIFNLRNSLPSTSLDMVFLALVMFLSWGLTGLVLGGFLTNWKRQWIWAGAFGSAGLVHYLFIEFVPLQSTSLLQTALFNWLPLGVLVGLAFALLARREPSYRQPDPLPRFLVGGGVVFFLAGMILHWVIEWTTNIIAPGDTLLPAFVPWSNWINLFFQVIAGLLEGLGMGLLLELPRLRRK